ncbi:hypothetical protein Q31b_34300 [Novipirellula aureliae]|uniref:Ferritin-like domain protein n=1 Tax=Novipirellula aureliae TaxID=2527966 RepID=A0A5C6DYG2_9BACT|nr:hypothetical protein [Novipirellula aureliae]TWU40086.1 hypothetical protein Q31b_34300 [Novipirellula aureliae]
MKNPRTVYEILQLLQQYHEQRFATYRRLATETTDTMAQILLEHLVGLEDHSLEVIRIELEQLDPGHATFLTSGPVISEEFTHAKDCRCESTPSFSEALACVLTSDHMLDELLRRLEGCSAAGSILGLAKRLRDLEETKDRQIANFTRMD